MSLSIERRKDHTGREIIVVNHDNGFNSIHTIIEFTPFEAEKLAEELGKAAKQTRIENKKNGL